MIPENLIGWTKPKVEKREEDGVYVVFWQGDLDLNYYDEADLRWLLKMIDDQRNKDDLGINDDKEEE